LIDFNWEHQIDMLKGYSLSGNAAKIKYAMAYKDFHYNEDAVNPFPHVKPYFDFDNPDDVRKAYQILDLLDCCKSGDPRKQLKQEMILGDSKPRPQFEDIVMFARKFYNRFEYLYRLYDNEDRKNGRECNGEYPAIMRVYYDFKKLVEQKNRCCWCGVPFSDEIRPGSDRLDNKIGHTVKNTKLSCVRCNTSKSDNEKKESIEVIKIKSRLYYYAMANNLPMLIPKYCAKEEHRRILKNEDGSIKKDKYGNAKYEQDGEIVHQIIRENLTGGLSNVIHRLNYSMSTYINKLYFDEATRKIIDKNTK